MVGWGYILEGAGVGKEQRMSGKDKRKKERRESGDGLGLLA
jgi:hypothetical protein